MEAIPLHATLTTRGVEQLAIAMQAPYRSSHDGLAEPRSSVADIDRLVRSANGIVVGIGNLLHYLSCVQACASGSKSSEPGRYRDSASKSSVDKGFRHTCKHGLAEFALIRRHNLPGLHTWPTRALILRPLRRLASGF